VPLVTNKLYFNISLLKPMLSNLLLKFLFLMVKISKFFFSLMLLEILHVTASGYISPA
jgi:hypothetical protein